MSEPIFAKLPDGSILGVDEAHRVIVDTINQQGAEIERLKAELNGYAGREALSLMRTQRDEIAFLEKALEQAIQNGELSLDDSGHFINCGSDDVGGVGFQLSTTEAPELAAYLRDRVASGDNRPPSDVVQNVVQNEAEG